MTYDPADFDIDIPHRRAMYRPHPAWVEFAEKGDGASAHLAGLDAGENLEFFAAARTAATRAGMGFEGSTTEIVCEADRVARRITFYVRDGFGDGADGAGLVLSHPETQERDMALRMFGKALDIVTGKQSSAVPVERWGRLRAIRAGESAGMAPA